MKNQLQDIRKSLAEAGKERGRLTRIAADCGLSYRTIYGVMHQEDKTPSASTVDKLAAYFKKAQRRAANAG